MRKVVRKQPDRNVKRRRWIEEPGKIIGRMEDFNQRFQHISEQIFDSLDNRSLFACKEVSRSWHHFLDDQKFLQIRIIQKILEGTEKVSWNNNFYNEDPDEGIIIHFNRKLWNKVFHRCNTKTILDLKSAVIQLRITAQRSCDMFCNTPLHTAASCGNVALLATILDKIGNEDLSCGTNWGGRSQPINFAASGGHLEVCRLILETMKEKNLANNDDLTVEKRCWPNSAIFIETKYLTCNLFVASKKRNHEFTSLKCFKMSLKAFKMKKQGLKCFLSNK